MTNYLVTDLECTCTDSDEFPREEMETIEIGAVLTDQNFNTLKEFTIFVKPTTHPKLTEFCKTLTTITQEQVDNGIDLQTALNTLHSKAEEFGEYRFVSWGGFDYRQINRECKAKGLTNPIPNTAINISDEFFKFRGLKKKVGIRKALNILNLKFLGTPHRGIDDAQNIVRVAKESKEKHGFELGRKSKKMNETKYLNSSKKNKERLTHSMAQLKDHPLYKKK